MSCQMMCGKFKKPQRFQWNIVDILLKTSFVVSSLLSLLYGSPTNAQNPLLFTLCMHDLTVRWPWRHRFTVDQFVFKTTLCNIATL
jgi:hypothetical protein